MILLKQLSVTDFKQLRKVTLRFPEQGAVLISGANEAGKSTLFEAVFFALYGKLLSKSDDLSDGIAYGKKSATVALTLSITGSTSTDPMASGDTSLEVTRTLQRNESQRACLQITRSDGSRQDVTAVREINRLIVSELGGLDADALLNSCFVEQKRLERLEGLSAEERLHSLARLLNLDLLSRLRDEYRLTLKDTDALNLAKARAEVATLQAEIPDLQAQRREVQHLQQALELRVLTQRSCELECDEAVLKAQCRDLAQRVSICQKQVSWLESLVRLSDETDRAVNDLQQAHEDLEEVSAQVKHNGLAFKEAEIAIRAIHGGTRPGETDTASTELASPISFASETATAVTAAHRVALMTISAATATVVALVALGSIPLWLSHSVGMILGSLVVAVICAVIVVWSLTRRASERQSVDVTQARFDLLAQHAMAGPTSMQESFLSARATLESARASAQRLAGRLAGHVAGETAATGLTDLTLATRLRLLQQVEPTMSVVTDNDLSSAEILDDLIARQRQAVHTYLTALPPFFARDQAIPAPVEASAQDDVPIDLLELSCRLDSQRSDLERELQGLIQATRFGLWCAAASLADVDQDTPVLSPSLEPLMDARTQLAGLVANLQNRDVPGQLNQLHTEVGAIGSNLSRVAKDQHDCRHELAAVRDALIAAVGPATLACLLHDVSPPAAATLEQRDEDLTRQLGARESRLVALISEHHLPEEPLNQVECQQRLTELEYDQAVRAKAVTLVDQTRRRMIERVLPSTMANMCRLLPLLTAGRYHDARITTDYRISVWDEEASAYRAKQIFSGGTRDQLSLALRLAFALATLPEELGSTPGFIFLDEVMSASDDERSLALQELITRGVIGQSFPQIFIVAHGPVAAGLFPYHIHMASGCIVDSDLLA